MKNQQIAKIFLDMANILELRNENVFRVRAYRRAAQNIDGLSKDVASLSEQELTEIPGVGKDLAGKVQEYVSTGTIKKYEELKTKVPEGLLYLLTIPGLGPKKAMMLHEKLKINNIDELEELARAGKLAGIRGMQKKTEENILRGIEQTKRGSERKPIGRVMPLAEDIIRRMREKAPVQNILVAGSLRRWKDTVKDIDILATSRNPAEAMQIFVNLPHIRRVIAHGATKSSVIADDGIQIDLRIVEGSSFGAALQYFTGSKQHNIKLREMGVRKGLKINEYGVFKGPSEKKIGGEQEEDVYRAIGLPFIPPELREDSGEIEAAQEGKLPELITLLDIKGDLHVHTKLSDGSYDPEKVIQAAIAKGYQYIAVTDHTKGLGIARGLDETRLEEEILLISSMNEKLSGFKILTGTEINIKTDGTLDLPDGVLSKLDIVIASIHSGFKQSQEQITQRILSAIRHPLVTVIGHPTGRLIGERDPYPVDMDAVLREAARYGVAMEVNAYPARLDLNEQHIKEACRLGVPLVINTDMHVVSQYDFMNYGVSIARRGWVEKKHVLNTLEYDDLMKRLRSCRTAKQAQRAS